MRGQRKRRTWPLAALGLGVLTAGASLVSEPSLEKQLSEKVAALADTGISRVEVSGREVRLKGAVESATALEDLKRRVHAIEGVRLVDVSGIEVKTPRAKPQPAAKPAAEPTPVSKAKAEPQPKPKPEPQPKPEPAAKPEPKPVPVPPPAPVVMTLLSNKATPEIVGKLLQPQMVKKVKVELAGKTYEEGDGHLVRKGEVWLLKPAEPLAEGTYDVKVIVIGEGGASSTDRTTDELVIDLSPPAAAQPEPPVIAGGQVVLRGTWAEGDAKLLRVVIGEEKYDIDAPGSPLVRDGDGRFRLILPASKLPDLRKALFLSVDEAGNVSEGRLPEQVGNTCQQRLNDVLIQDMIHFKTGSAEISDDSMLLLDKLAEVLKGCPDMEVLIVGHTDNVGNLASNQELSENRANAVKQALVQRGLQADHIVARGEGETQPLVPNDSDRNRQINRRIEITVRPREQ